jgi:hypothetical protein
MVFITPSPWITLSHCGSAPTLALARETDLLSRKLEETKGLPYHERVQALQSHHLSVQEMIRHDLIYQPLPE